MVPIHDYEKRYMEAFVITKIRIQTFKHEPFLFLGGRGGIEDVYFLYFTVGEPSELEGNYAPSELINVVAHGRVYKYSRCIGMCVECHSRWIHSLWVVLK